MDNVNCTTSQSCIQIFFYQQLLNDSHHAGTSVVLMDNFCSK